jgi:hypothetical protein
MALSKKCGGPRYEDNEQRGRACGDTGPHKMHGLTACVETLDLIKRTNGRVRGNTGHCQCAVWPQCVATRDLKQ